MNLDVYLMGRKLKKYVRDKLYFRKYTLAEVEIQDNEHSSIAFKMLTIHIYLYSYDRL